MKQIKTLLTVCVLLAAFVMSALADSGTQDFGITNAVVAAGTDTTNVGSAVNIQKQGPEEVGLVARVQGSSAATGAVTFVLARSADGTDYETTPRISWAVTLNGTTEVVAYTNLTAAQIGAAGWLKVISVANADDTIVTNAYLKAVLKRN